MNLLEKALVIIFLFLFLDGSSQIINESSTNPNVVRELCTYTFDPQSGNTFYEWIVPDNCKLIGSKYLPTLQVKWKNVEASAENSTLNVIYYDFVGNKLSCSKTIFPFYMQLPTPTFLGNSTLNMPCYSVNQTTISLKPYINTLDNEIDKDLVITSQFEWTLPSGWQTTTGQTGTFVSTSSINVVPPASASSVSISVRAKANTQYSLPATLQITRNLENFAVTGPTPVLCNTTQRYTAPAASGVTYTWHLPNGWEGTSTTNYIDVLVKGASGSVSCTMTGCNGTKTSSLLPVEVNTIDPNITLSGPSLVCASGATFTISSLATGNTVLWETSSNLIVVSGQGTTAFTVRASGGILPEAIQVNSMESAQMISEPTGSSGWVRATISNSCGSVPLEKTIWAGLPGFKPVITGPTTINCGQNYLYREQNTQPIYWSVPSAMQIIGSAGPGYKCIVKGLEFAAAGVIGTVSNACGSFTDILEVDIECSMLTLFPNPASSSVEVTITDKVTDTESSFTKSSTPDDQELTYMVRIINNYGVTFYTAERTGSCFTLPVDKLKDGNYIVQVINGDNVYSNQLVVKR